MNLDSTTLQQISGLFAVLLGVIGYAFYIWGIYKGKIKPHAFSWLVWGILTAIGFIAQAVNGAGPGAWVTGFTAAMSFIFVIVGLGSSSRTLIARSDWIFLIVALLAIPPWYFTGNALWSVIMITIIDAVAFVPTFRKGYRYPETESALAYLLQGSKFIFGILAIQQLSLVTALYPASLIVANGAFALMLLSRGAKLNRF